MSPVKKSQRSATKRKPSGKGAKAPARAKKGSPARKKSAAPKKKTGAPKRKARAFPEAAPVINDNPEGLALARKVAQLALDKKAENIVLLDVRGKTSYADYLVIASGESERQVAAMAEHIETQLKAMGHQKVGSEGYETGQWVLIDFGEVVVHLFYRDVREFYDLDGLWADAKQEKVAVS